MSRLSMRFVDVQITEPQFAADPSPPTPLEPPQEFDLADDEKIAFIGEHWTYSGVLNHDGTLHARLWIQRVVR